VCIQTNSMIARIKDNFTSFPLIFPLGTTKIEQKQGCPDCRPLSKQFILNRRNFIFLRKGKTSKDSSKTHNPTAFTPNSNK
jgi:hypothetical protein